MCRFFENTLTLALFLCAFYAVAGEQYLEAPSSKSLQDKYVLLHKKANELIEYVHVIRTKHASGEPFSYNADFQDLNERINAWKEILLAESGYVTKQQEKNWHFCGAGFDDYRACFYQHQNIQASLSVLQQGNSNNKINEALDNLEKDIKEIAKDSKIASTEANRNAAHWIDAWLQKNNRPTVRCVMQKYQNSENAEIINAFLRCWYSGEFWNQSLFDTNNKLECMMYIFLSERAHYAATFGGIKGVLGYCKRKGYCFAEDYVRDIISEIHAHFSTDSDMMDFLSVRLSPENCGTIRTFIISSLFDADE